MLADDFYQGLFLFLLQYINLGRGAIVFPATVQYSLPCEVCCSRSLAAGATPSTSLQAGENGCRCSFVISPREPTAYPLMWYLKTNPLKRPDRTRGERETKPHNHSSIPHCLVAPSDFRNPSVTRKIVFSIVLELHLIKN